MSLTTVGLISPGEMGSSIAARLCENGLTVLSPLADRSEATRANADRAGIEAVTAEALLTRADLVLSVVVPEAASSVAAVVAAAAEAQGVRVPYADLNPVTPSTVRAMAAEHGAHLDVVDGCIVGPAADLDRVTVYLSGPDPSTVAGLDDFGIATSTLGDALGQASGLKLCYGGLTKGLSSLGMDLLLVATGLGIVDEVASLYGERYPEVLAFLDGRLPGNATRAERRAQELDALAATLDDLGYDGAHASTGADRLHWLADLELDTDDAEDAVEAIRRLAAAIE